MRKQIPTVSELVAAGSSDPVRFLMEVMEDKSHPIDQRIKCAVKLVDLHTAESGSAGNQLTVVVGTYD